MRNAGAYLFASVLLLGACGVGDEGTNSSDPDPNPNRLKCSAALITTGTFQESLTNPRPIDPLGPDGEAGTADDNSPVGGCWPVGTWTFTATIDPAAEVLDITGDGIGDRCGEVPGTQAPALEASYSFSVERTDDPNNDGLVETYTYLGSSPDFFTVKVSEGGSGDCEGIMEFKSADAKEWWTFNPQICTSASCNPVTNTITGSGDFTFYLDSQPY
jgi:hypothetical protein